MKNKDNIEILIGQVWRGITNIEFRRRVVGFTDCGNVVTECLNIGYNGAPTLIQMKPDSFLLNRLISCPVLGTDMGDYDIVTKEQKEQYTIPGECEAWNDVYNEWIGHYPAYWEDYVIYRVPRGFNWEPYRKDKQPITNRQRLINAGVPEYQLAKVPEEAINDLDDPIKPKKEVYRIVSGAFIWDKTPQSVGYWEYVCGVLYANDKYTEDDEKEYWAKKEQPKSDIEAVEDFGATQEQIVANRNKINELVQTLNEMREEANDE